MKTNSDKKRNQSSKTKHKIKKRRKKRESLNKVQREMVQKRNREFLQNTKFGLQEYFLLDTISSTFFPSSVSLEEELPNLEYNFQKEDCRVTLKVSTFGLWIF